jgi:hypothetical protein
MQSNSRGTPNIMNIESEFPNLNRLFPDKNINSEQSGKSVNQIFEDDSIKQLQCKGEREKPSLSLLESQVQKKNCTNNNLQSMNSFSANN